MNTPQNEAQSINHLVEQRNLTPDDQKRALELVITALRAPAPKDPAEIVAAEIVASLRKVVKFGAEDPDAFLREVATGLQEYVDQRSAQLNEQSKALEAAIRSILLGKPCDLSALSGNPHDILETVIAECVTHWDIGDEARKITIRTLLESLHMTPADTSMGNIETMLNAVTMLRPFLPSEGLGVSDEHKSLKDPVRALVS